MRMRRSPWCCIVLRSLLAPLVLAIAAVPVQGRATVPASTDAGRPIVDVTAFRGQGRLAFLWGHRLYVLDGDAGRLWTLPQTGPVDDLSWSPDGHWLAYIATVPGTGAGPLWLVRFDGHRAHQVAGLGVAVQAVAWSPVADTLAAILSSWSVAPPSDLWLLPPSGHPRPVAGATTSVAWSPDGKTLAYSATPRAGRSPGEALWTVPALRGAPTTWFTAADDFVPLAGWWPDGKGVLFWRDPGASSSIAADGLGLFTLRLGGKPRQLATTLSYPDQLAQSPSGHDLALVAGFGREMWHDKVVATCDVSTGTCRALPHRHGVVMLDPSWSPRGNRLAFVQARDAGTIGGFGNVSRLLSWVHTRTLWVADPNGRTHELRAAGTGVYDPQWSRDGRHVLYLRDNAIWLIGVSGGPPVKIVDSSPVGSSPALPTALGLFGYYGHVSWSGTLAWFRD
jgi:TolB protein